MAYQLKVDRKPVTDADADTSLPWRAARQPWAGGRQVRVHCVTAVADIGPVTNMSGTESQVQGGAINASE